MPRGYIPGSLQSIKDPATRDFLARIDAFLRDSQAQQSTQESGTTSPGSVTNISANGGTKVTGDVNLKDGSYIDVTQSGQDFTIAVDTSSLGGLYLARDGSNTMDADITFSNAAEGLLLKVVDDLAATRTYRLKLVWNSSVDRPMINLTEVV